MARQLCLLALGLVLSASLFPCNAAPVGVVWTDASSGTLDGIALTLANATNGFIDNVDLTGSDFSAHPLGADQQVISYAGLSNWTLTFSSPVTDLLLYTVWWRGIEGQPSSGTELRYTFDQAFVIDSGNAGATIDGNTLVLPLVSFYSGVLRFPGTLTSLSVTTNSTTFSHQDMTFGLDNAAAVPEPSGVALAGLGIGLAVLARRRRCR